MLGPGHNKTRTFSILILLMANCMYIYNHLTFRPMFLNWMVAPKIWILLSTSQYWSLLTEDFFSCKAMDFLKVLFHFFMFFPVTYASYDCQYYSWCSDNNILIRFPFQIQGQQNPYCGYPGFRLTCSNDSKTVITLPYSGKFFVRNISYLRQEMRVHDPDNCLPKRLLSLNLSGSPFIATSLRNYTVLRCPTRITGSQFIPIECLSNSTSFVSAIPSVNFTDSLPDSCHVIKNLSFARPGPYDENLTHDFSRDLRLTWYAPDCRYCESQEALCGFETINSDQVGCFSDYQTGKFTPLCPLICSFIIF
ncbi:unnamed protein product [Sphenostylis stenocarpa]|uniref:RING-type E3 ubiquitin transferase n=1 Tax=Sphenostylis stenocarpa TaxID=92480 RepID=A0AA86VZ64_9FABA|nr:unnamed protein product [Sphenostylis stenocarpa]